jgi:hypothetical protein
MSAAVAAWLFFWLFCWPLLGCIALSVVDNKDTELLHWLDACPLPVLRLVALYLWPVLLCAWVTRRWWQT